MELQDIKQLWGTYEQKLDRNWKLNLDLLKRVNLDKAQAKITNWIWVKGFTLAFLVLSTFFFIGFTIGNLSNWYMALSGILLVIWTISLILAAVHEFELISRIDYSAPITELQKKLAHLKLTTIKYMRLSIWIFPLYMVFIVLFFKLTFNLDIVAIGDRAWLLSQIPMSILFLLGAIWAHRKLTPENANKPWMNKLLKGNGSQIADALTFIKEIEKFEKDEKTF